MDEQRDTPAPDPEAQRLGAIVGRWRSEGHVVGSPPVPVTGTDVYEWAPGGFFLVHHVDVTVGDRSVRAIEIIGERDPASGAFIARDYDNVGHVTIMHATIDADGVWTFTGRGEVAPAVRPGAADTNEAVRSTLTVSADGASMTARWERSDDWLVWEPLDEHDVRASVGSATSAGVQERALRASVHRPTDGAWALHA